MVDTCQGVLFPDFDSLIKKSSDEKSHQSKYDCDKSRILNLQWHNSNPVEGKEDMPLLMPYDGELPESLISYSQRNQAMYACGIHCFEYDFKIEGVWNNPNRSIACLQKYQSVMGPDFSVFVDQPRAVNVWNIYRNRWVSSFWQANNINVIPSASWGNVDSFEYCFDGLPVNSVIAIGHIVLGKDRAYKRLYRTGVEALIERKSPSKLIVYGSPLDFDPGVDLVLYEGSLCKIKKRNG